MVNLNLHRKLYTLVLLAVCFALSGELPGHTARAQHEGHDMSNMPGMSKPKPKAPKKRAAAPPKKTSTPRAGGPQTETNETTEPSNHDTHTETTTPAATAPSPSEMNTASPAPDAQPHATEAPPNGRQDTMIGMPGMDMSSGKPSGMGRIGTSDLMEMSGEQMNIVLRASASGRNSISMGQMGSGSSWQPATTPMYMWYKTVGRWLLFLHGDMKLGVNAQGGPRGVAKFESQNWIMPMAFTRLGRGTLQLRGMFSLEPFSFPQGGSPLLISDWRDI